MRPWWQVGMTAALGFLALVVVLWPTSVSFYSVWSGGQTYNHGFVILPITLWLIWQKRQELSKVWPEPAWWPMGLMLLSVLAWLTAYLVGVQVVAQAAFVSALLSFVIALLGWRIARFLTFPLLFLYFGVPVGAGLIPPLMHFTVDFTVHAIRLTGIPVYQDGFWFTLPNGSWSVVEACSGLRYIIASVTLGFLYSYLSYHTLWKRLAFIALTALVPILANGLRAYMIVMIGYLSGMKYATGVDHLIYGWVFFGLVMLLLFWIGNFWAEDPLPIPGFSEDHLPAKPLGTRLLALLLTGVVMLGGAAVLGWRGLHQGPVTAKLDTPAGQLGWQRTSGESLLYPTFLKTSYRIEQNYRKGDDLVSVFVAAYPHQRQGFEVVAKRNAVVGDERGYQQVHALPELPQQAPGIPTRVDQLKLTRKISAYGNEHTLVWQWFRIAGRDLTNPYLAKAWEAWARIVEGRSDGEWIAVATPMPHGRKAAREVLIRFMQANYPALRKSFSVFSGRM